ncbi:MAG TPA: translation elongation factor Ts [Mycobacteriales bacterium]|nr:translation elongation factor Ts [Mycobacteriales bacterium]
MANYTAADVKKLRETTGAGMMDCKNALTEADGDIEKAIEVLRIKGQKGVGKRESRDASNGLVTAVVDSATGTGVMLELNCETDFVAKTDGFQELAATVAGIIEIEKPADSAALLAAGHNGATVKELLDQANATLGEKIEVSRFARFAADNSASGTPGFVATYLHKSSPDLPPTVGVLIELDAENAGVAKDVAQHIAAMMPRYVSRDEIPEETLANERRIAEETAREEGKPEQALPRIIEGRVNGFVKEVALVDQPFVREAKKTVGAVLAEAGVSVRRFERYRVGQA